MIKLVISDLHLAGGSPPGEFNPIEDFHADGQLSEFVRYYSNAQFEKEDVELILGGDFLDPLKIALDGKYPDKITDSVALRKVSRCLEGHPQVVKALRNFIETSGKSVTYMMGNHDLEIAYLSVQNLIRSVLAGPRHMDRIRFRVFDPFYDLPGGVRVCHGDQYEALNKVDLNQLFLTQGHPEPILNLPWGSIFLLKVLLPVKHKRPYINLVHPFGRYVLWAMVTDTSVALPAVLRSSFYFMKTRFWEARKRAVSFRQTLQILSEEAVVAPNLEETAFQMFDENPGLHAIIMGHSHVAKVRKYGPRGALYINTGTWTKLISLDLPDMGVHTRFTYAMIDYRHRGADSRPEVTLNRWFGQQKPYSELKY